MSSQGETETRMILGDTLSNTRILVIGAVFGMAILIAVSIKDKNIQDVLVIICPLHRTYKS